MCGDQQEGRRLVEAQIRPDLFGVGDELVGHLVQRHLGDVEAVREDQLQQQVERTLEVRSAEPGSPALRPALHRRGHVPNRAMTSRASDR